MLNPKDAAYVTNEWLKPKFAIPIHYGTNPQLKGTPEEYLQALGNTSKKVMDGASARRQGEVLGFPGGCDGQPVQPPHLLAPHDRRVGEEGAHELDQVGAPE